MYRDLINEQISQLEDRSVLSNISDETSRIKVINWLNALASKMSDISELSFSIKSKGEKSYILFKFKDLTGYKCNGSMEIGESIPETVDRIASVIVDSQWALKSINDIFERIQTENGLILSVKYKFGYGKYATVAYWDYSHIIIKLNADSVNQLIEINGNSEQLDNLAKKLQNTKYPDSVPEFLTWFNGNDVNKQFGMIMNYKSIPEALTDNMLSRKDVLDIIEKNKGGKGTQKLKSVEVMDQLGLFVALIIWNIDYERSEVSIDIMNDSVIDIENSRFVSDHSLYSRIEQRIFEGVESDTEKLGMKAI